MTSLYLILSLDNEVFDFSKDERMKSTRLYWVINDLRLVLMKFRKFPYLVLFFCLTYETYTSLKNKLNLFTCVELGGDRFHLFHPRYIVQNKPKEWSGSLKNKFFRFLELFLSMLRRFQVRLLCG